MREGDHGSQRQGAMEVREGDHDGLGGGTTAVREEGPRRSERETMAIGGRGTTVVGEGGPWQSGRGDHGGQ